MLQLSQLAKTIDQDAARESLSAALRFHPTAEIYFGLSEATYMLSNTYDYSSISHSVRVNGDIKNETDIADLQCVLSVLQGVKDTIPLHKLDCLLICSYGRPLLNIKTETKHAVMGATLELADFRANLWMYQKFHR